MTYSVATWEQWTAGYSPLDSIGESEDSKSVAREQKEFLRRIESNKPSVALEVLNEFLTSKGKETFPQTLIERLSYLEEVSEEEYPEQGLISEGSLRFFLCFIQWLTRLSAFDYPDVVLTPDGNIRAIWRSEKNRYFALEFLQDGIVRFVAFYPGSRAPSKMIRSSGMTTIDNLLEASQFPHVLGWDRISA